MFDKKNHENFLRPSKTNMKESSVYDILLDMPQMYKDGVFNAEEQKWIESKNLFHTYAFSYWKKYYLLLHYGNLISSLEKILQERTEPVHFLEVGCGTASTSVYLSKNICVKSATGLDLNEGRIRIAKKRIQWHEAKKCDVFVKDIFDFIPKKKFDVIYSLAAFELMKPYSDVLAKLHSFLVPEGEIILDMANPFYVKNTGKYLSKEDVRFINEFFRKHGFAVKKEYHSFLTGLDKTGNIKKLKEINNCIRIHASKRNVTQ